MTETGKKILIVEDERPMARALQLKLQHAGFVVDAAFDGEQAIQMASGGGYDFMLLDLIIPKKDGFTVLKELQEKGLKTPIVITSNLSQEEDEKKARELGAVGYLIKSNTPIQQIVEKVQEMIAK